MTMPMSALGPPTSKVMRRRLAESSAAQAPPSTPAAGPDMSVMTGTSATIAAVATPPLDPMMCRSPATPASFSRSSKRRT